MICFNNNLLEISLENIEKYREKTKKFLIPDPNKELTKIYEIDKLVNLIGIRAEKYDSPEYQKELLEMKSKWKMDKNKKEFKIPRGIQNPNYTQLLELVEEIRKIKNNREVLEEKIIKLFEFITIFYKEIGNRFTVQKLNYDIDVRLIDTLEMYLNYLYTKYNLT